MFCFVTWLEAFLLDSSGGKRKTIDPLIKGTLCIDR